MLTLESKSKMLLFMPLALMCTLCLSENSFSQNHPGRNGSVIKFANVDFANKNATVTYEQILANPGFTILAPGYEVLSFTLSFQPKGKDFIGPYTTKGSKLTDKEIEIFKKLRDSGNEKVKVFLEDIKAAGPDKQVRSVSPLIFTIEQH